MVRPFPVLDCTISWEPVNGGQGSRRHGRGEGAIAHVAGLVVPGEVDHREGEVDAACPPTAPMTKCSERGADYKTARRCRPPSCCRIGYQGERETPSETVFCLLRCKKSAGSLEIRVTSA